MFPIEDIKSLPILQTDNYDEGNDELTGESKMIYTILGFVFSLTTGIVAGYKSRSILEALIFAFMFFGEGLACEGTAKLLSSFALQRSTHRFAAFFCLMGLVCTMTALIMKTK